MIFLSLLDDLCLIFCVGWLINMFYHANCCCDLWLDLGGGFGSWVLWFSFK